jgi:glycine dehydrogenase subunit 1
MTHQHRYIPNTTADQQEILQACGADSFEALLGDGIPHEIRFRGELVGGRAQMSEFEIDRTMQDYFAQARNPSRGVSFLGSGSADRFCPTHVNQLTLRGEFLTAYTPYQPENSQGTLQALFEFQSMVAEIFGMDVATASHYDGATALAEAVLLARRVQKKGNVVYFSAGVHPEYLEVCKTYLGAQDVQIAILPLNASGQTELTTVNPGAAQSAATPLAVVVQSPNVFGVVEDLAAVAQAAKNASAISIVSVTDPVAMGMYEAPGQYGIDVVTGEGQAFGLPQSYGGPYLGLFCARKEFVRQLPGRLCGETIDANGKRSFTLTLSTREQHIRRDKATSNICTNQNLCALWATIWLASFGKAGFEQLAEQNHAKAGYLRAKLSKTPDCSVRHPDAEIFNEFTVDLKKGSAAQFFEFAARNGLAPGIPVSRWQPKDTTGLIVCVTEKRTKAELDKWLQVLTDWGRQA